MPYILLVSVIVNVLSACSTQKNTSSSRFWHSFTARYNTYYNGSLAYIDGSLAKENGNKDNYTEPIPLYTVGNKASKEIGKSNFETAITKAQKAIKQHSIKKRPEWSKSRKKTERDLEWLNRREYNPFIWKAWMLMGRSQFHSGAFDEAAATFSYMSRLYRTQPAIYAKARAWLAKCYIEQDWMYDAEDVIRNMQRDSIDRSAQKEWDYTLADYYLHNGDMEQAANYLRKVVKHEMRSKQKAREWFLLGQVLAAQHKNTDAYNAFRKCIAQNPPYELEFNARIAMTEVMPTGAAKSKIARLRRMARSDKNKDYLDQVYYALGNVYLAERDTLKAIGAYEQGNKKATRSGIEKGVLLLNLGDLYWTMERFGDAQRCYGEAIGLLDKERPDYPLLSYRSKVLDELAPHTEAVHLQDSLQALAKMSEKDRNAAIDRVIDALKKKEKEERLNQLEQQAQKNNASNAANRQTTNTPPPPNARQSGGFYFYSPAAVQQGKQTFKKVWGNRENVDNWQRMNKTNVASNENGEDESANGEDIAGNDSIQSDESKKEKADTAALDPHKREYYMAQIPFTEEQVTASNAIIADGLFNSGIIFKDKLDNLSLSEKALVRLNTSFPEYEKTEDIFYHLFLLYSRKNDHKTAEKYKRMLAEQYADGQWNKVVNDPYFEENARFGTHREDSLYADTYEAFRNDLHDNVARNVRTSEMRYPLGANRDKFLFISGLSRLNMGDADSCVHAMERVVKEFPQSEVAGMAGMIINGVKAGKKLHGAKFDITNIWDYRSSVLTESADTTEQKLSEEPLQDFVFMMTYDPDSISENQLLYELAKYNFTSYLVRNFNIDIEDFGNMHRLIISGFNNFDEALVYARSLYRNARLSTLSAGSRSTIISKQNLALLGTKFSYNDYDEFYEKYFAPLPSPELTILNEQAIDPELYNPENEPAKPKAEDNGTRQQANEDDGFDIMDNSQQQENAVDDGFDIIPEQNADPKTENTDEFVIPENFNPVKQSNTETETETVIETVTESAVDTNAKTTEAKTNVTEVKANTAEVKANTAEVKTGTTATKNTERQSSNSNSATSATKKNTNSATTVRQELNANILEIIDESAPAENNQKTESVKEQNNQQNEDEYFDLDGF